MADILDDQSNFSEQKIVPNDKKFIVTLLLLLFTGFWLYYWNPQLKRKYIYLFSFWYSWLSFANVILVCDYHWGFDFLEDFHNHTSIGGTTVFIGWIFYYIIGFIDWVLQARKSGHLQ